MISLLRNGVNSIAVEDEWNFSGDSELLMHTIHTYPAEFSAFIATKAFDYTAQEGVEKKRLRMFFADVGQ